MAATGPGSQAIDGKDEGGSHFDGAAKAQAAQIKKKYGSVRVTLPDGTDDADIITLAGGATAFANMVKAHHLSIFSTENIEVRLNDVGDDKIFLTAGVPFPSSAIEFDKLFFSNNSGVEATVDVVIV